MQRYVDDAKKALLLGGKYVDTRVPCLKKYVKSFTRIANETYGSFSNDFKSYFITSGLMNYIDHYCNIHEKCDSFIPHTTCNNGTNAYQPNQPYCTDVDSGRGERCDELATKFFRIITKGFIFSSYMEKCLNKISGYVNTTSAESYMHTMAHAAPKYLSIKGDEYELIEAMNFIRFSDRQAYKTLLNKLLHFSKNSQVLVATSGQMNATDENFVIDAISTLFTDKCTLNDATYRKKTIDKKRVQRIKKQSNVTTNPARDLLGKAERPKSSEIDGIVCGQQKFDNETIARISPPFPCKHEKFTNHDERLQKLKEIWEITLNIKTKAKKHMRR